MIGLDFCNIDQPQVSYALGKTIWATGPVGYLRAHGRRREKWFEFGDDREARYDYLYAPEELQDLAARTRELLEKTPEVYVIFNNHPRGQAVANALELSHILTGRAFPLPLGLIAAFPRLAELGQQNSLWEKGPGAFHRLESRCHQPSAASTQPTPPTP